MRTFCSIAVRTGCPGEVEVKGVAAAVAGLCHLRGVLKELAMVEQGLQGRQAHQRHARSFVMDTRVLGQNTEQCQLSKSTGLLL